MSVVMNICADFGVFRNWPIQDYGTKRYKLLKRHFIVLEYCTPPFPVFWTNTCTAVTAPKLRCIAAISYATLANIIADAGTIDSWRPCFWFDYLLSFWGALDLIFVALQ